MKFICFTWALVFLVACFKMYFISAILIGILLYIYVDVVYVKMMEYAHMRIRNGMVYEEKVQEMKESRFSRKITLEEATEIHAQDEEWNDLRKLVEDLGQDDDIDPNEN